MPTFLTLIALFFISAFARDCRRRRIPRYCLAFTYMAPSSAGFDGNSTCPCFVVIIIIYWVVTGIEGLYQKGKAQKRIRQHESKGPITENTCPLFAEWNAWWTHLVTNDYPFSYSIKTSLKKDLSLLSKLLNSADFLILFSGRKVENKMSHLMWFAIYIHPQTQWNRWLSPKNMLNAEWMIMAYTLPTSCWRINHDWQLLQQNFPLPNTW